MGFWVYFKDDKTEYYDSDACELYFSSDRSVMIVGGSKAIFDFPFHESRSIQVPVSSTCMKIGVA